MGKKWSKAIQTIKDQLANEQERFYERVMLGFMLGNGCMLVIVLGVLQMQGLLE